MNERGLIEILDVNQQKVVDQVRRHANTISSHSPRFAYFTLHNDAHINNLFSIADLLICGGVKLSKREAYLLALALCTHDLGMVAPLHEMPPTDIMSGMEQSPDPAILETFIRDTHHDLIDNYTNSFTDFLTGIGLDIPTISLVRDIGRCHRKVHLDKQTGMTRYLGALMRLIDELDIGPARAPIEVFKILRKSGEMDATSAWHWYKHIISEDWEHRHNVTYQTTDEVKCIRFDLVMHPGNKESLEYWFRQSIRPIIRVLDDEGCGHIIRRRFGVQIEITKNRELSTPVNLGNEWKEIEEAALSHGRKTILLIDDESRRMSDLMLPIMQKYHVVFSHNAADAFEKLKAMKIDLAIVDLQIGAGGRWGSTETEDFRATGANISHELESKYPNIIYGILTGSRHNIDKQIVGLSPSFILKKPIMSDELESNISTLL